ncbi:MAG: hypothetical protein GXP32_01345 [Kiritimatiellaeota bacterium]|nr:hypothetical protein [Kiritimatiellota bacterium]
MSKHEKRLEGDDRNILRELAAKVALISSDSKHAENAERWTAHNDLKTTRPMVLVFPEGSWRELMPDSTLTCENEFARNIERSFRQQIYYSEHLKDDNPIENIFNVSISVIATGHGLAEEQTLSQQSTGAKHYETVIHGMEDIERMKEPTVSVDWEESKRNLEFFSELLGDILDVRQIGHCPSRFAPIDEYAKLRGMETIFYDMIDCPELIHEFCRRVVDGRIHVAKKLEEQGVLTLNLRNNYSGSGGNCYTNDLPYEGFDGEHVRTKDFWGFATAQIFSEVSPEMHEEFALTHEKRLLDLFGLNSYGCCEPLHHKLDMVIKHIPRLRRVSISPWANIAKSAEILQDKYIYSWKPNPAILAGEKFNAKAIREETRDFCEKTRGCVTEIIMKDTHTVKNEPGRIWEWVRIAKEVAAEFTN